VGWGSGEDEEAGAILKVHEALGIFYFGTLVGLQGEKLEGPSLCSPSPYRFLFSRKSFWNGKGPLS
jgi:hypothetical protein